jgi:hypothetical protein
MKECRQACEDARQIEKTKKLEEEVDELAKQAKEKRKK